MEELLAQATRWGPHWFLILVLLATQIWLIRFLLTLLQRIVQEREKTRAAIDQIGKALHQLARRLGDGRSS